MRSATRGIRGAFLAEQPPAFAQGRKQRLSARRRLGINYETRLQRHLCEQYPNYLPNPWFCYWTRFETHWCQADGLLIDPNAGRITIVEAKYTHTQGAWRQLFTLYLPVVEFLFGKLYEIVCVEVCKWFDCAVDCKTEPVLITALEEARPQYFNVLMWR